MLASKSNDHEGFYLLQTMIECMPAEALNQYIKGIFQLLFSRLTSSKTTKFVKSFLVFIFLYTCHHGGQSVQELIDSIQPNMFGMVIDRLVILEVQKVFLFVCLFIFCLFDLGFRLFQTSLIQFKQKCLEWSYAMHFFSL